MPVVTLQPLEGEYAICRLNVAASAPRWAIGEFVAVARTSEELSVICPRACVPAGTRHEAGWAAFKFEGPFAFTATGILASVLAPLAQAEIPILAQSTFETDYLLVPAVKREAAVAALRQAGHVVRDP
jgi:hypothetical protein